MPKLFQRKRDVPEAIKGIRPLPVTQRYPSVYEDFTGLAPADIQDLAGILGVEFKGRIRGIGDVVDVFTDELETLASERAILQRRLYFMSDRLLLHKGRDRERGTKEFSKDEDLIEREKQRDGKTTLEKALEERTKPTFERELAGITEKMNILNAIPEVRANYENRASERRELLEKAMHLRSLRREINQNDTLRRMFTEQTSDGFARVDDKILEGLEGEKKRVMEEITALEGDDNVVEEANRQELVEYKRQLRETGFVVTPTVEARFQQIDYKLQLGKPVFVWGHTGTGKSQTLKQYCKSRFGVMPELQPGGENVNQYDFFGTMTVDEHKPGPVTRSLFYCGGKDGRALSLSEVEAGLRSGSIKVRDIGRPLLMDEVDLIEHKELGELHYVKDAKPGEEVNIPLLGRPVVKGGRWCMFETANLKSPKYNREEMDPAYLRRDSVVEWGYLPSKEVEKIMQAVLADNHGNIALGEGEDMKQIENLALAAKFIQDAYTGTANFPAASASATVGGKAMLKKATLSIQNLIDVTSSWKKSGFQQSLDEILLEDVVRNQTEHPDQIELVHILKTIGGFFKNYSAAQIDIPGLDDSMLRAWAPTTTP